MFTSPELCSWGKNNLILLLVLHIFVGIIHLILISILSNKFILLLKNTIDKSQLFIFKILKVVMIQVNRFL